jgi:hypothetical protein
MDQDTIFAFALSAGFEYDLPLTAANVSRETFLDKF